MGKHSQKLQELEHSGYGTYQVKDKLDLCIQNNLINIEKTNDNQYLYSRKSDIEEVKHRISVNSNLSLHVAPILPLNLPENKTNLFYLDFEESFHLDAKVTTKVTVPFPIEIGVFTKNSSGHELLDCFSCKPALSRFALYGNPTEGHFCKYANVNFDTRPSHSCHGNLDITIRNNSDSSVKIEKIVYDATVQDVFYSKDSNTVKIDPILVDLDEKNPSQAVVSVSPLTNQKDHALSPRVQSKSLKPFAMTGGYD